MKTFRRVSLSLLFLFAFATSASPECAWVLWSELTIAALPESGEWYVLTAYPTMQDCEAALAKEYLRLKGEGWQAYYVQVRTVFAAKGKGERITTTHYRCLPDTVDPRGPKGK